MPNKFVPGQGLLEEETSTHTVSYDPRRLLNAATHDIEKPAEIFERHQIRRVALVLGSSRETPLVQRYRDDAYQLAERIAAWSAVQVEERKLWLCSGGKGGIMSAVSEGAASVGARSLGFGFALPGRPPNHWQEDSVTHLFSELGLRDFWLFHRSVAVIAFPGGLGTLMELFDALLHMQVGMRKQIPIFLYGSEFWKRALDLNIFVEGGLISSHEISQITICDSPDDVLRNLLEE